MTQNKRDSMVFYRSIYEALLKLPARKREVTTRAIFEYAFNNVEPIDLDPLGNMVFTVAKPLVDHANQRYNNCVNNGKKGGRPRKQALSDTLENDENKNQEVFENENQEVSKSKNQEVFDSKNLNDNDNDNDNDNVNDNENVNDNPPPLTAENVGTRKTARGEYNNVFISGLETVRLINELGYDKFEKSVEFLSGYLIRKPNHKSACHYEDLRGWVQKALVDRGIIPSPEKTELAERYKKQGFDFDFEDIFEQP